MKRSRGLASALQNTAAEGAVMVEYAVLVGAMALGAALGLVGVGIALVDNFDLVRSLILAPIP
jgi:Flp pilus assembly pilin Flp